MPCACQKFKIGSMKKKHKKASSGKRRYRVSGMGGGDIMDDIITTGLPGVGMILADELKGYALPMIYSDTDTAEQKKTKNLVANVALIGLSVGAVAMTEDPGTKKYVSGFASGVAGQAMYALWKGFRTPEGGTASINAAWKSKAYDAAKAKLLARKAEAGKVAGNLDNSALGLMGPYVKAKIAGNPDNASPSLMGPIVHFIPNGRTGF